MKDYCTVNYNLLYISLFAAVLTTINLISLRKFNKNIQKE